MKNTYSDWCFSEIQKALYKVDVSTRHSSEISKIIGLIRISLESDDLELQRKVKQILEKKKEILLFL